MEATKNICRTKDEGRGVDPSTVTRNFKKFYTSCKDFKDQAKSDRLKTMDSEAVFQAIEANLVNSTQRVSDELSISQSSMICYLNKLGKNIWSCQIVPHISKILQNFWLTLVT